MGESVDQDYTQTIKWFESAAYQNEVNAQFNLAVLYEYGEGVR
ncbi:MAG: hypothetical protein ACTH5M_02510 [Psychrobacter sp.]